MPFTFGNSKMLRRLRNTPTEESILLEMPVDVIECIADHLPLADLLSLSQSSSALNNIMRHRIVLEAAIASDEELLESLEFIAPNLIDKWVCFDCLAIHDVDIRDVPHQISPEHTKTYRCPKLQHIPMYAGPSEDEYQLQHHHVQLALRYSRMEVLTDMQQDYLQRLLTPHTESSFNRDLMVFYSVTPRIIKEKYVRKSVWTFRQRRETPVAAYNMGAVSLCCHMRKMLPTDPDWTPDNSGLTQAINYTLSKKRRHVHTCSFCATDFRIRPLKSGGLEIVAWQCLGREWAFFEDKRWDAAAWDSRKRTLEDHKDEYHLFTKRGTARKLWGDRNPLFASKLRRATV